MYDAADRLTQKTKGDGDYETYAYDVADQLTGLGYFWADTTFRNGQTYTYDAAGKVVGSNQGFYATTYGYDGSDQQTSEISLGSAFNVSLAYTYDHNGNRLTQTSLGSQVQSFVYDAHDKLTSGLSGETEGYDLNGNRTSLSLGGVSYTYTYDDEDRLTKLTSTGGLSNTFSYNGLGLRVGKVDSTGSYVYTCDGTSPGSPVLSDIYAVYTPGQSEHRGSTSYFYANDRQGNLWTLDGDAGGTKSQYYYQDTTGFGALTAMAGTDASPFKFGGGNGCQTDADTGLVLMGHRYFDSRTGRFINQDPAEDGDNWYAYADNDPLDEVDPEGLMAAPAPGIWSVNGGDQTDAMAVFGQENSDTLQSAGQLWLTCYQRTGTYGHKGSPDWVELSTTPWQVVWSEPLVNLGGTMFATDPLDEMKTAFNDITKAVASIGKGDTDKAATDGAKAYNKSLKAATGVFKIAEKDQIHDLKRLQKWYGGSEKYWKKMGGWMPGLDGGPKVEIHWYENAVDALGRYFEAKCKLW